MVIDEGALLFDGPLDKLIEQYVTEKILTVIFAKEISLNDIQHIGSITEFSPKKLYFVLIEMM